MANQKLELEHYLLAKKLFEKGENVTQKLKEMLGLEENIPELISLAYDLQSGSYSSLAMQNCDFYNRRAREIADFIGEYIKDNTRLLDVGSGELTLISRIMGQLVIDEQTELFATDISWSRLFVGKHETTEIFPKNLDVKCIVSEMSKLPFSDKSIDITLSDHALEPNGSRLETILVEIFRCTLNYCIFVEPCNLINGAKGTKRMERLGYIFNLEEKIEKLGGVILKRKDIKNNYNNLNKARILVVKPPSQKNYPNKSFSRAVELTVPGSNFELNEDGEFLYSTDTGLAFPILKDIPILLLEKAILSSQLS